MSAFVASVFSSGVDPTVAVKHGARSKWSMSAATWFSGLELAVACGMPHACASWISSPTPGKSFAPVVYPSALPSVR